MQEHRRRASCFTLTTSDALATQQRHRQTLRKFSLSIIASSASANKSANTKKHGANLGDLPTEILEQIFGYLYGSSDKVIHINRAPGSSDFSTKDLVNGDIRRKWTAHAYPKSLFLVNRRISAIAFDRLWSETTFVLSLSSTDSLCFLKYALSERQRVALRRIRFTRFMLSWEDGVGDDIWLTGRKQAPAFLANIATLPDVPRVNNLVTHLHQRNALVPWVEC